MALKYLFSNVSLMIVFFVLMVRPADAYLDPGSGSMLLQVIVALVAAGLITIKAFWHRIRDWLKSNNIDATESEEQHQNLSDDEIDS